MNAKPQHLKNFWNKKNILFVSLVLIFALTVGVTVAWLTANGFVGSYRLQGAFVDCAVVEDTFIQGTSTTKSNVRIQNTGNTEAYIRATYTVTWVKDGTENTENPEVHATAPVVDQDYSITFGDGWVVEKNDYFYFHRMISPDEETSPLIQSLTKKSNGPAGYNLQVTILPEAVQAYPVNDPYHHSKPREELWEMGLDYFLPQDRPVPQGGATPLQTSTFASSIMTFNIRQSGKKNSSQDYAADSSYSDWYDRRAHVVNYLQEKSDSYDLICLQEVTQEQCDYILENLTAVTNGTFGYTYYKFRENNQGDNNSPYAISMGIMTLYKKATYIYLSDSCYWLTDTPSVESAGSTGTYRMCSATILQHRISRKILGVFNAQLDANESVQAGNDRSTSIHTFKDFVGTYILDFPILAGSFGSDAYNTNKMEGFVDDGKGWKWNTSPVSRWYEYITRDYYCDTFWANDQRPLPDKPYSNPGDYPTTTVHFDDIKDRTDPITGAILPKEWDKESVEARPYRWKIRGPVDFIFTMGSFFNDNYKKTTWTPAQVETNAKYPYYGESKNLSYHYPVTTTITFQYRVTP